jgi:hypothetical protein
MEEFIHQESKDLWQALVKGVEITWPSTCRNCDFEFPSNLKSDVCKTLLNDPLVDMLSVVSSAMRLQACKGHHYCCINNFKPVYRKPFQPPEDERRYYVCTETLMVEEGLDEWYDLEWDGDEPPVEASTQGEQLSLFDLISS